MILNIKYLISIAIILIISGCSTKTELFVTEFKRSGLDMVVMEEESKVTYIKDDTSMERFCASREIDSLKISKQGFSLGGSFSANNENIGEEQGTGAMALGGRSPAVLITRELMFRACELSLNLNTNIEQTIDIYKLFLQSISSIVKNEHDKGSSAIALDSNLNLNTTTKEEKQSTDSDDDSDE